jgi:TrmH family RNA methyltransferase
LTFDIVSTSNPRIQRLARLSQRRHRDREGVFLVEGRRLFQRAIAAGLSPIEVYGDGSVDLGVTGMVWVKPNVLDGVSYRDRSQGLIAVFPQHFDDLASLDPRDPALLLVAESLEKPGNLGAMLRTADAVGADAVVSLAGGVDRFNPNVLRASTGACFSVPTIVSDIVTLSAWLTTHGIGLVAADPMGSTTLWDADLRGPLAVMVGAEDRGLSHEARSRASLIVTIPMEGAVVDSLNASVTMALLAYEAVRQRHSNAAI